MGYNQRKIEDERRREAEKQAAAKRAPIRNSGQTRSGLWPNGTTAWRGGRRCCSRRRSAPRSARSIGTYGPLPWLLLHPISRPAPAQPAPRHMVTADSGAVVPQLPATCAIR